jgi:hypothetical protein
MTSRIDSSSGRRLIHKWQLLKKHHSPSFAHLLRIPTAFSCWPLPSDKVFSLTPFSSEYLNRVSVGSTPVTNKKMTGWSGLELSYISAIERGLD